jgi:hypothetical protein
VSPDSVGKVDRTRILNPGNTAYSSMYSIVTYINTFNLQNWAAGDYTQYDPTKIVNSDRLVDLTANSPAIVKEKGFLYLVGTGSTSIEGGERGTTTELTQAKEGQKNAVAISFEQGSSTIDAETKKTVDASHPKVKEIGDKILAELGETGILDSMTLTSSASPEWNNKETMANYKGKVTSGTGVPAAGTDFAALNAKLAYDRGVTFQKALTDYLGATRAKANSIKVGWKISTDEPGGGKNISYTIVGKSESAQPIEKTSFQGAVVKTESDALTLYVYKINYDASAFGEIEKGGFLKKGMIPYEKLTAGQKITILATDMKTKGEREVSKVENNTVYFKDGDTEKPLPKERYVGQVGKAKGTSASF